VPHPEIPRIVKWFVFSILTLSARAADCFEQWDPKPAVEWSRCFQLESGPWAARVTGSPEFERIPLFENLPGFDCLSPKIAGLRLLSLNHQSVTHYRHSFDQASGIATSSFQQNGARITQQVFLSKAEKLLVVHLHSDKPGALSHEVALELPDGRMARVRDRRELDSSGVRAWVLPFESDVETTDKGLAVRGEGEMMILLATGSRRELDSRIQALGLKYDERETFPNLAKVWSGLLLAQQSVTASRVSSSN
jgi:hypothetical protein